MCLIVVSKKPRSLSKKEFYLASTENPDGIGISWKMGKHLQIFKTFSRGTAWKVYDRISSPSMIHFRLATEGKVTLRNCHPFPVGTSNAFRRKGNSLFGVARAVVAHNGHIHNAKGLGKAFKFPEFEVDSEIVAHLLSRGFSLPSIEKLLPGQRLAIWDAEKDLPSTIGSFLREGDLLFSNTFHRFTWKDIYPSFGSFSKFLPVDDPDGDFSSYKGGLK